MKILFIGCVDISQRILKRILQLNGRVVGVVTKGESGFNADYADLRPLCQENGIPCYVTDDIHKEECVQWMQDLKPDVIFCFGWSQLLKEPILRIPPQGVFGYHPAKLPQNRGRHPLIWALTLGLEESASTFFEIDLGADSGDILSQVPVSISYEDDASTLYEKVCKTAVKQVEEFLPLVERGTYKLTPQEQSEANLWRKRKAVDGRIDFRMNSRSIYNLTRALTHPYPGATVRRDERDFPIWKVREVSIHKENIEPGKVLAVDGNKFTVKTSDGAVEILKHDLPQVPVVGEYL